MAEQIQAGNCTIELLRGDITKNVVDAIVNAANSILAGGGGVDGALRTKRINPGGTPAGEDCDPCGGTGVSRWHTRRSRVAGVVLPVGFGSG